MGIKYHIKNQISKKELRKQRKSIIPVELMKEIINDLKRLESRRGNLLKDNVNSKDI
jgi:hypothetical protein